MDKSLIQRHHLGEEGDSCKTQFYGKRMTVPIEKVPANLVPAAAVRQEGRALFGIIGRKGSVGGAEGCY